MSHGAAFRAASNAGSCMGGSWERCGSLLRAGMLLETWKESRSPVLGSAAAAERLRALERRGLAEGVSSMSMHC